MNKIQHLKFNDFAPDVEVFDVNGKPVHLGLCWKRKVLALAFTRHFGCPQCKEMADQLVTALPQFQENDIALVLLTQGAPEETKIFCAERAPGVTCLSDPERRAYRAYGLDRASLWQSFLSFHVIRSNERLRREKGYRIGRPPKGQDAMQMAGIFIIAPNGRIRLPYYYDDIADHPPLDLLLHGVMGVDWKMDLDGSPL